MPMKLGDWLKTLALPLSQHSYFLLSGDLDRGPARRNWHRMAAAAWLEAPRNREDHYRPAKGRFEQAMRAGQARGEALDLFARN